MRTNLPSGVIPISTHTMRFACGHDGPRTWDYVINGKRIDLKMIEFRQFPTEKDPCGECQLKRLEQFIFFCCRCGRMIFPGEAVTLYTDETRDGPFQPDHLRTWNRKWIGCYDRSCCPDRKRFYGGTWSSSDGFWPTNSEDLPPDV